MGGASRILAGTKRLRQVQPLVTVPPVHGVLHEDQRLAHGPLAIVDVRGRRRGRFNDLTINLKK
jgi:hypothetical protein